MELKDRERKVDLSKFSSEEIQELSKNVGNKIRLICDEAVEKANKIANIYGMKTMMQIAITPIDYQKPMQVQEIKRKRGRPKKTANL
jgi:uncharacterized protein (UPF0210 family)